ncbi:Protein NRT1/ PTR FAMILY 5.16 [Raphanus sativus]|uniref:Protein NRT1/ PTR FAMILY 5.15 isoform X1 n=1 Tax=Raphanus sativus TaxID=3726 RepID=A0A6J0KL47_RAPSA|nr:protein NRT1/ PTR FAMILY 5.15 isoform X1 [Raphanus sativus]KAJ4879774.1 Protein NRT1/ PTR FAMILY 5.16 [Raphanus sativus]
MSIPEEEVALLQDLVHDSVDHRGNPAGRSSTGGWRSASLIIGVEVAERFAYVGIACNMITYLTEQLGQSTANAAVNVNTWAGTASTLPIIGAFVADAYLGRYRTILGSSLIYILGLGLLTLSAILTLVGSSENHKPSFLMNVLFFCSLYLVAIAQGGHKPCVQAFGADQFDSDHPKERIARGSFFNWWFLCLSGGIVISILVVVYIQSNVNWALGFGVPCLFMVMALAIFFLGRKTYRYPKGNRDKNNNGFVRIGRVFVVAFKNRKLGSLKHSGQLEFLGKAMLSGEGVEPCSNMDVEDAKGLIMLIPIWITSMMSMIPYAQYSTLFTKQGVTVDRRILPSLEIPPASFLSLVSISVLISVPIYEHVFLPIARKITKKPNGITMLQRIGTGMVLTCFNMVLAALVEAKRLRIAEEHGLIDKPDVTIPMSIWWFVPQYMLVGMIEVFGLVGAQEFFYDQVPTELRSIGLAFSLSSLGLSNFLSGLFIIVVDWATGRYGGHSWFNNNLNRAHIDYFYWLLAASTAIAFFAFVFISRSYVYRRVDQVQ